MSTEQESPWSWLHARPSVLRVNRCGTLFCEWGQKPPERSSCTLTSSSGDCQALVQDSSSAYEPVPEGTKCGKEQVGRTCLSVGLLDPRASWRGPEQGGGGWRRALFWVETRKAHGGCGRRPFSVNGFKDYLSCKPSGDGRGQSSVAPVAAEGWPGSASPRGQGQPADGLRARPPGV